MICTYLCISSSASNNLNIVKKNGSFETYNLSEIKRLTFIDENLEVAFGGNVSVLSLSDIEDINFQFLSEDRTVRKGLTNVDCYPNPTEGDVTVESLYVILQIEVFNIQGARVIQTLYPNSFITQLPISSLNKGVYFIQLKTDKGMVIKKTIKK